MTSTSNAGPTIAAVVVTFNRFELLQQCIGALRAQSRKLDQIIVVNNGSTDGKTGPWLDAQTDLTVIHQPNGGSSGGQLSGIRAAYQSGHDWFWCMDDDTIPEPLSLERLTQSPPFADASTGFLASLVLWTDGTPHLMNVPNMTAGGSWMHTVLKDRCVRVSTSSFVALLAARRAVEKVGLPLRDMFIWFDDVEFTQRISHSFNGYLVLDSIAIHRTAKNLGAAVDRVTPETRVKYACSLRNHVIVHRQTRESLVRKAFGILMVFAYAAKMIVKRRAPVSSIMAPLRGLFAPIRIERPD